MSGLEALRCKINGFIAVMIMIVIIIIIIITKTRPPPPKKKSQQTAHYSVIHVFILSPKPQTAVV